MQTKKWYQSKTIWGGIIAIIAAVLSLFGKQIDAETQDFLTNQAVEIATAVATMIAGVMAIYGRFKADKKIE
jgi:uncharacterized membrane protein YraQ (UPF0718 family)